MVMKSHLNILFHSPGKLPLWKQPDHGQSPGKEESGTGCQGEELLVHSGWNHQIPGGKFLPHLGSLKEGEDAIKTPPKSNKSTCF